MWYNKITHTTPHSLSNPSRHLHSTRVLSNNSAQSTHLESSRRISFEVVNGRFDGIFFPLSHVHPFVTASINASVASPLSTSLSAEMSPEEQDRLIETLEIFKIKGRDKRGRKILRVAGKLFPARSVSEEAVKKYLEERIFPRLSKKPFCVVYFHSCVQRSDNFPGLAALRSIYDAVPDYVRDNLEAVYFLHPGLQSRLFLATVGRVLFTGGLYGKVKYASRLDQLWDHVRRNEVEIPEYVYDHDEELELEHRPMMDYGLESAHPRVYSELEAADSARSVYSMRCIS